MRTAKGAASTLGDHRPAAVVCREWGWDVGTHLIGDEGYGPAVIRITAIGEYVMLARCVFHSGRTSVGGHELTWTLSCRDWQPCEAPPSAEVGAK